MGGDVVLTGLVSKLRTLRGSRTAQFEFPESDIERLKAEATGELAEIFFSGSCRRVHKWLHYLPIYERYLARFRGLNFHMLEIGVFGGGSLDMWRQYFGNDAVLYGIDINPKCKDLATAPTQIRIGSQDDPDFLEAVVSEMGGLDVVLDDGSHVGKHQRGSFEVLFPLLNEGGIYIIEDLSTSYWPKFEGGFRKPGTAIEFIKILTDDLHAWYHDEPTGTLARDWISAIHIHNSMVVIEKQAQSRPGHVIVKPQLK